MKKRLLAIVLSLMMVVVFVPTVAFGDVGADDEASIGTTGYATLEAAVEAATSGSEVDLLKDVTLEAQLNLPAGVTLDGNGKTITADGTWSPTTGSKMLVEVGSDQNGVDNVTIKNITLNSNNKASGLQAYCSKGLTLENVTLKNAVAAGLLINASQATIKGKLSISGNVWPNDINGDYINLGWGKSVSKDYKCSVVIDKDAEISDNIKFWTDDGDLANAAVTQDTWENKFSVTDNRGQEWAKTNVDSGIAYTLAAAKVTKGESNKNYADLASAVAAAEAGSEIDLLKDVTLTKTIETEKDITIDLNGHNITGNAVRVIQVKSGSLNISGKGTITANGITNDTSSVIRVGQGANVAASLVIGEDVTVTTTECYGVSVFNGTSGTDPTEKVALTVNGQVKSTDVPAVSGCGNDYNGVTDITIGAKAKISTTNENAIYFPCAGTLDIQGTVEGNGGIEVKSGETTVAVGDTAKITATAKSTAHDPSRDGCSTSGYAIALANNSGYKGGAKVLVKGGTITGPVAIVDDDTVEEAKKGSIAASGGKFSNELKVSYLAPGYTQSFDGTCYTVSKFSDKEISITEPQITVGENSNLDESATVLRLDPTDAGNITKDLESGSEVKLVLKTERDGSVTDSSTVTQKGEIEKAIKSEYETGQMPEMVYYTDAKLSYQVTGGSSSKLTETSALQTLAFDISASEFNNAANMVIVYRAHGTSPVKVTKLDKVSYDDFASATKECYCVNQTEKLVLVKTGKFSLYGIGIAKEAVANTHTVTFNSNGGSAVASIVADHGTTISEPAAPTLTDNTFKGWYKEAACTTAWDFATDTVTADTVLYAKWEPITKFNVSFNANGHGTTMPETQIVEKDGLVKEPDAPEAKGYIFKGWYKEAACTNAWNFATDKVTADTTLYAKWIEATDIADYTFTIAPKKFVYDGTVKTPEISFYDKNGIKVAVTYDDVYSGNRTDIGAYAVVVTGNGEYTGVATDSFKIVPNTPTLKVTKGKRSFTAKWTENKEDITRYQLRYSTTKKFTNYKNKYTTSTKAKIKKLKAKKNYYVKVRAYKTVGDENFYSDWSAVKKVKTR